MTANEHPEAATFRARGWWRDELPTDDLARFAKDTPDKVAMVGHRAGQLKNDVVSYGQLQRLVDRFAGALLDMGVKPGEVVAFQLPNWWQFPVLILACARIGAIANPLLPVLRHRELEFIVDRVKPSAIIVADQFRTTPHAKIMLEVTDKLGVPRERVAVVGTGVERGTLSFDEKFVKERNESRFSRVDFERLRPSADAVSQIMFTSGTTGEPKGVVHTHNSQYAGICATRDNFRLTRDDVVYMVSPLAHQTGYLHGAMSPLMNGMKAVYQDIWHAPTMLELVEEERVTWTFMGATAFMNDLLVAAKEKSYDLQSFRTYITGGEPIPPALIALTQQTIHAEMHTIWGMTENAAVTFTRPGDSVAQRASSDGKKWDGMELKIVDPESRRELPPGTPGLIVVKGAAQAQTYFARPDLYAAHLDKDGWFDTGDLAVMRDDGYIRITGRIKDLLIRGGENIPIVEIEKLLYSHPNVADLIIVGRPDKRLGERACAVVVPKTGSVTLEDLTSFLAEKGVAKLYWPEFIRLTDALPRTASGKIQRFKVQQMIAAEAKEETGA